MCGVLNKLVDSNRSILCTAVILCNLYTSPFPLCAATPDCEGGSIRLVGGGIEDSNAIEGAVQICLNGVWGSITSSVWAFSEARIVCRMLGRDEYGT